MPSKDNTQSLEFPVSLFVKPMVFVLGMVSLVALLSLM